MKLTKFLVWLRYKLNATAKEFFTFIKRRWLISAEKKAKKNNTKRIKSESSWKFVTISSPVAKKSKFEVYTN